MKRTLTIDLDTGEWIGGGTLLPGDGARVASSVLPGMPQEEVERAYSEWMQGEAGGEAKPAAKKVALFEVRGEVTDSHDPRQDYLLTADGAYRSWPCAFEFPGGEVCRTRLDEHADQVARSRFPTLDIEDHEFIPMLDEGHTWVSINIDPKEQ